jgi:hypothetical protein
MNLPQSPQHRNSPPPYWPPEPPPPGAPWLDALWWLIVCMNRDDSSLAFICGCLSYALQHQGSLTEKQARPCQKVFERVLRQAGVLDVQLDRCLADAAVTGNA